MNPNLYDLLDVDSAASDQEIRAAWKAAIADLDPTDRRFRVYNQAAEVLLDPARRASYDAELVEAAPEPEPEPERVDQPSASPSLASPPATTELKGTSKQPGRPRPWKEAATLASVPTWLLIGLAVVTAAALGATAYFWTQPSDASVEDSTRAAQSAAEKAIVPVLSYDAAQLDQDQEAAQAYLTSDYRKDYDKLFEVIRQNAPETETVVSTEVIASGIVRSGENRVEVLLFVNRPTTNKLSSEPVVYKDQVTVTMEQVGEDWLVDEMVTSPVSR